MTDWRIMGFLCETTLTDQDQRGSIIGILPGRVVVNGFPTAQALGAFVRISPLPPAGTPIKIEILLGDLHLVDLEAPSVVAPPDAANVFGLDALHINIARIVVMLNQSEVIRLKVGVGGADAELVAAVLVEAGKPIGAA